MNDSLERVSAAADEQVEVFDNGLSLGFVKLVDGKWELLHSGLATGSHHFTAKYQSVVSDGWDLSVVHSDIETFDGLSSGAYASLNRPFYTATYSVVGPAIDPPMSIYMWSLPGELKGPVLRLKTEYTEVQKHTMQMNLVFRAPCSRVSFWANVQHRGQNSLPRAVSKVVALNGGSEVASYDFTTHLSGSIVLVVLGVLGQSHITSLRFNLDPGSTGAEYADEWLYIDNIVMAR